MAKGAVSAVAAAKSDPSGLVLRPRHVAPDWVCEFVVSARFRPVIAYDFARPAHISCLESRTVKTLTMLACRTSPDARIASLFDSRVTFGAGAKGRSSSAALNRIQQGSLGYVLGGGLYLGPLCSYGDSPGRRPHASQGDSVSTLRQACVAFGARSGDLLPFRHRPLRRSLLPPVEPMVPTASSCGCRLEPERRS